MKEFIKLTLCLVIFTSSFNVMAMNTDAENLKFETGREEILKRVDISYDEKLQMIVELAESIYYGYKHVEDVNTDEYYIESAKYIVDKQKKMEERMDSVYNYFELNSGKEYSSKDLESSVKYLVEQLDNIIEKEKDNKKLINDIVDYINMYVEDTANIELVEEWESIQRVYSLNKAVENSRYDIISDYNKTYSKKDTIEYNRNDVINYANKYSGVDHIQPYHDITYYCCYNNGSFGYYESDCDNVVSQCLLACGLRQTLTWNYTFIPVSNDLNILDTSKNWAVANELKNT